MKMQELRAMAKRLGINSFGKSKVELIRGIQRAEGNFDCFGTARGYCDQEQCMWRALCLEEEARSAKKTSGKARGRVKTSA